MRFAHGITVTLLRETRDRLGDVTLVEDFSVPGCGWSPAVADKTDSTEIGGARTQTITGRTLRLPPDTGITATHRVRFPDGSVWEVDGEVGPWRSPLTGWAPGDQAKLRRVRG